MPILTDFSQIAISCAVVFPEDMKKGMDTAKMQDIIRHVTLNSIATYNRDYRPKYGELILCCDSSPSWRHKVFKYYKAGRKDARAESDLDWDTIFQFIHQLREDLINVFPYKVIRAEGAEGDDCIAVLTKYLQTESVELEYGNTLDALTNTAPPVLIVSADHDFKQLHKYKTVKQWSPMQKKWVTNPEKQEFIIDKIIEGDKGDGVPSVLMEDDFLVNGEGRAKSVTKAVRQKYRDYDSLTQEEKERYDRNKLLIDFDSIPKELEERIIEEYTKQRPKTTKQDIFNYLVKNRCRVLIDKIGDF